MKLSRFHMISIIFICLLAMAGIDFVTGQELVFSCAYLLPVSLAAWWFSRRTAVAVAVASGLMAFLVDELDGADYSHPAYGYWNALTCLFIATAIALVLSRLRQALQERDATNQSLRDTLTKLEDSTHEIRQLQEELQTICAWTKRIKVGDIWMTPDEFLSSRLRLRLSHGISPEAEAQVRREIEEATRLHDVTSRLHPRAA